MTTKSPLSLHNLVLIWYNYAGIKWYVGIIWHVYGMINQESNGSLANTYCFRYICRLHFISTIKHGLKNKLSDVLFGVLSLFNCGQIRITQLTCWRDTSQISEQSDDSFGFDTYRDLTIKSFMWYSTRFLIRLCRLFINDYECSRHPVWRQWHSHVPFALRDLADAPKFNWRRLSFHITVFWD